MIFFLKKYYDPRKPSFLKYKLSTNILENAIKKKKNPTNQIILQ